MLPFGESFGAWVLATVAPAFVGLVVVSLVGRMVNQRFVAAFALGIFFWFFVDTIEGSSDLLVNFGFSGGVDQVAILALFIIGILSFFYADSTLGGGALFSSLQSSGSTWPVVAILAALAVGIHGFGEGTAFGSTAALTSSTDLLDAFGGTTAGVAYVLHKMLEPMMVGALYVSYSQAQATSKKQIRDILLLTSLFVLPSVIGAATGYFISYDATYFFGLGTGTSIYAAFRLAGQVFNERAPERLESLKVSLALIVGFILIYIAALFHS